MLKNLKEGDGEYIYIKKNDMKKWKFSEKREMQ